MAIDFSLHNLIQTLGIPPPQQFQPHSKLNFPHHDKDEIASSISTLRAQLSIFRKVEEGIISLLQYVSTEQEKVALRITQEESLLAPITHLPLEILTEIFEHVRSAEHISASDGRNSTVSIPITAQVCQTWRNVSLSSPRIWSRIVIHQRNSHDMRKGQRSQVALANIFLARSNVCPLMLRISSSELSPEILEFIQSTDQSRWKDVDFDLAEQNYAKLDTFKSGTHFPLLTSLNLRVNSLHIPSAGWTPEYEYSVVNAPNLRSVFISSFLKEKLNIKFQFNTMDLCRWSGPLKPEESSELLASNGNLEVCHYRPSTIGSNEPIAARNPRVPIRSHHRLTTLHLPDLYDSILETLPVELPNLRRLGFTHISKERAAIAVPFFERWSAQLEVLVFPVGHLFPLYIRNFPNLTTAHISNWAGQFVSAISTADHEVFCGLPKLRTIYLSELYLSKAETLLQKWRPSSPEDPARDSEMFRLIFPVGLARGQSFESWESEEKPVKVKRDAWMNYRVEVIYQQVVGGWHLDQNMFGRLVEG